MTKSKIIFIGILLLAIFLRFYSIGYESLWLDEGSSYYGVQSSYAGVIQHCKKINQPPLYLLLLKTWSLIFGKSEIALRSLSVLFGLLSLIFLYLFLKKNIHSSVAFIGSFLFALSKFHIEFSQEVRNYNLLVLLSILISYFLFEYLRKSTRKNFLLFFLFSLAMLYTHIYGWFMVGAVDFFLFYLLCKKKIKIQFLFMYNLGLFIFFLPWLFVFIKQILLFHQKGTWISKPTLSLIIVTFEKFSNSPILFKFYVLLSIVALFVSIKERKKISDFVLYLFIWLLGTLSLPLIISLFSTPIFIIRYSILSSTAFLILVSLMIFYLSDKMKRKKLRRFFLSAILIFITMYSFHSYTDYFKIIYGKHKKEEWREASQYIKKFLNSDEKILLNAGYCIYPFSYYFSDTNRVIGVNTYKDLIQKTNELSASLFVVYSHNLYTDPEQKISQYLLKRYNIIRKTNYNFIEIFKMEKK